MRKLILLIAIAVMVQACEFESYQDDPNRTEEATPGLVLTQLIVSSFNIVDASPMLASRMLVYTDGLDLSQYYGWARSGFGGYDDLRQVAKMVEEAERNNQPNYIALGKFFRAYHAYNITMAFGDVPMSEAVDGFNGNYQPAYDSQEEVFVQILQDLEEANAELDATQPTMQGDVLFFGDVLKWRKAINSFKLRVLMSLSGREGNSTINISGQFDDVLSDPSTYPIMSGNEDNLALQYYDVSGNRYPNFENQNLTSAYLMETTFTELMKEREDPRLFVIGSITPVAEANGLTDDDFDAYGGLDGSAFFDDLNTEKASGVGSLVDPRYHMDPTAEPGVVMGFAELQFIIAEAIELGWTGGNAEVYYNNGIEANMAFYGIEGTDVDDYLSGSMVAYNSAIAIDQINIQKYLTYFFTSGWEPFYNQRRTGVPTFSADGGTLNEGQVPVRWMYPQSELQLNRANVEAAINSQFGGNDNINGQMWILK